VPVNVAVEEPWARVVGEESYGHIVARIASAHDVADYRIDEVIGRVSGATNNGEGMSVQVNRMLQKY
jgi:hypothetical protein